MRSSQVGATTMTIFDRLTPDELDEFQRRVGGMIVMLPIASGQLGHTTAAATIDGNYLAFQGDECAAERAAKEFVNDLFKLSTPEMCKKWFGDENGSTVRRSLRIVT